MKIAVALEGTLSDASHRFNLKDESFEAYQNAHDKDEPNTKLIEFLNQVADELVVYSTTPDNLRLAVSKWLMDNGVEVDELVLKKKSDYRPEYEIKVSMIERLDNDYKVVVENSAKVADLLREKGYLVLQT